MQVKVYPSRAVGWSGTPQAPKSGGEPPSWIAGRGSTCQALESCW
jgi:hypothetical protein